MTANQDYHTSKPNKKGLISQANVKVFENLPQQHQ
jgi:hypothetical protein